MRRLPVRTARLAIVIAALALPARSQETERSHVPFAVGERLEYDLKFGKLRVGSASMEVAGIVDVRGRETWHTVYEAHGGVRFLYNVDDTFESWIDRHTFNSLRFRKDQNEGRRDVEHVYEIYPERAQYTLGADTAKASVRNPLDDGSFLYFLRTIPLVVGQTYTFDRYFIPDRNPVTIRVVRRDTIDVPAGRFAAIVLQPVIKTSGIFSENGRAEVWLSDDKNHIMLQMKSALPFGSINLYLKSYRPAQAPAASPAP
jgi:hypothetical protein